VDEINTSPHFRDLEFTFVEWSQELSPESYCDLLCTYSDHSTLSSGQRDPLLDAVREAICHHGDTIRLDYRTGLFLTRVT
jgi:hypothetical protein